MVAAEVKTMMKTMDNAAKLAAAAAAGIGGAVVTLREVEKQMQWRIMCQKAFRHLKQCGSIFAASEDHIVIMLTMNAFYEYVRARGSKVDWDELQAQTPGLLLLHKKHYYTTSLWLKRETLLLPRLKAYLKAMGLSTLGRKDELLARLANELNKQITSRKEHNKGSDLVKPEAKVFISFVAWNKFLEQKRAEIEAAEKAAAESLVSIGSSTDEEEGDDEKTLAMIK